MKRKIGKVNTLLDALPFIKKFNGKIVVIKYGGSAQTSPTLKKKFAEDILLLYLVGIKPVIVHGGGKRITELLSKLDIDTQFIDGQRVTSDEVMRVVEMVLSGEINKEITAMLNHFGAKAIGISGKDSNFITAKPLDIEKFGRTGIVDRVDAQVIHRLLDEKFVPVIAPIGAGKELGDIGYNINADFAASAIAKSIGAEKILFLTDTAGVLDKDGNLIDSISIDEVESLKSDGTIYGGMIPKVDACIEAVRGGVKKAHIIDGRIEHSILLEILTSEGIGTEFVE
ncbi:MAG TPA: acetylglutamate kinase [Campylobacterales bacterium]|nr:acetylglutamate kinase [Campylobacterales bacterium]